MNLLQLVIKQMRQRALSTWLTLLSVMLGVGLAVAIMIFRREGEKLFGQSDYGYDLIVGAKASKLQLVLNTVYHLDVSPGNIPYSMYRELAAKDQTMVWWALPMAVGDEYNGYRVVATGPNVFPTDHEGKGIKAGQVFEYRLGRSFEFAQGRAFHPEKFEAVLGSEVAAKTDLRNGGSFKAQHGIADARRAGDIHEEKWTVVGVLKPTQTAADRAIYIPLITFYAVGEHEKGLEEMSELEHGQAPGTTRPATGPATARADEHEAHPHAYELKADGTIELELPQEKWKVSAILVRTRGGFESSSLAWQINNLPHAMAVSPAVVMREFYDTFLKGSARLLLFVSLLVTVVAAVSILVSIYNAVSARLREIAILRALGATRQRVLVLICLEAGLVGLVGGVAGLIVGHLLGAGGSFFLERLVGQRIGWLGTDVMEWLYLVVVVMLAVIAGLVPAMKAYRTPVATHLVAE
ncbi:MAG: ABC transporter permease [Planctomycetota bacterium]|nr:ABC transporter permease [Planctomycetota bacterium]